MGSGSSSALLRWAPGLMAGILIWCHPSSGAANAVLWGAGLYALWQARRTWAAWAHPAGICFGLGILWAIASLAWSMYPMGSARDLIKSAAMTLGAMAIPVIFDRPDRVWAALLTSAVLVTLVLTADLLWMAFWLGGPWLLPAARFFRPYLYTHPNVSSMMAGLCVMVFTTALLRGVRKTGFKLLLLLGIGLALGYLVVMGSRGPQLVFALAVLVSPAVLLPGWRSRLVAAVLAAGVATALWWYGGIINPRFKDHTMLTFNYRVIVWRHARHLADQQPWGGYGYGKKAFVKAVYENPQHRPPRAPVRFPHTHSYWLMLYFQGGGVAVALWSAGWLALLGRLVRYAYHQCRRLSGWRQRLQVRLLPALLAISILYILLYGIGDYPDHVIRHTLFYLAGLAAALTAPRTADSPA